MPELNRRTWLQRASAAVVAWSVGTETVIAEPPIEVIDTHTHFYDPTRPQGVPWPGRSDALLYRKVLPDEFKELTKPFHVVGTVVVEASPWLEDNRWLLDLAENDPFLMGIVGHLDLLHPDFPQHLARFVKFEKFKGIRLNEAALVRGLKDKPFSKHLAAFAERGLTLDINGGPTMLRVVDRVAKRHPELTIVINHAANQPIDGKMPPEEYQHALALVAEGAKVYCKVSALVEATGQRDRRAPKEVQFYGPHLDVLWEKFGPERLLYGSNWPVSDRAADYATVIGIVANYFRTKGRAAAQKFFHANARQAYRLPPPPPPTKR